MRATALALSLAILVSSNPVLAQESAAPLVEAAAAAPAAPAPAPAAAKMSFAEKAALATAALGVVYATFSAIRSQKAKAAVPAAPPAAIAAAAPTPTQ